MVGQAGPARAGVWAVIVLRSAPWPGGGVSTRCFGPRAGHLGEVRILGSEVGLVLGLLGLSPEASERAVLGEVEVQVPVSVSCFRFPPKTNLGSFECFCLHILNQKVAKKNSGVKNKHVNVSLLPSMSFI